MQALKIKRPLSGEEKQALITSISSLKRNTQRLYKRIPVVSLIICGILWGITMLAAKALWQIITLFWICICIVISAWIVRKERQKYLKRTKSLEDALNRNEAEVVHIKSNEVVEFEEIEDEGAGYAFQVDDENIALLTGQEYYSSAKFPNDNFEIIHIYDLAGNLVEIFIEKHGNKLKPVRKISAEAKKRLRPFEHLEMVKGKLADLEQILRV